MVHIFTLAYASTWLVPTPHFSLYRPLFYETAHQLLRIALAILMHQLKESAVLMFPCLTQLTWRDWPSLRCVEHITWSLAIGFSTFCNIVFTLVIIIYIYYLIKLSKYNLLIMYFNLFEILVSMVLQYYWILSIIIVSYRISLDITFLFNFT